MFLHDFLCNQSDNYSFFFAFNCYNKVGKVVPRVTKTSKEAAYELR